MTINHRCMDGTVDGLWGLGVSVVQWQTSAVSVYESLWLLKWQHRFLSACLAWLIIAMCDITPSSTQSNTPSTILSTASPSSLPLLHNATAIGVNGEPFVVPLNWWLWYYWWGIDGQLYPSIAEGTHAHIDKEGRCYHMKGSGRLCTIIARRRSTHNMMLLWHTLNVQWMAITTLFLIRG
jgi:hypothetical protein